MGFFYNCTRGMLPVTLAADRVVVIPPKQWIELQGADAGARGVVENLALGNLHKAPEDIGLPAVESLVVCASLPIPEILPECEVQPENVVLQDSMVEEPEHLVAVQEDNVTEAVLVTPSRRKRG